MEALTTVMIPTRFGEKSISVFAEDVLKFDEKIDILTVSAFYRNYAAVPGTLVGALGDYGVSVNYLANDAEIDFRRLGNVWLSKEIGKSKTVIERIGCIEMSPCAVDRNDLYDAETAILKSFKAYFQMLDLAQTAGVEMKTVALPLLGAGNQKISGELTIIPMLNECIDFLKRNSSVERIYFIELKAQNALKIALALEKSYALFKESVTEKAVYSPSVNSPQTSDSMVFISYNTSDRNIADNLCAKLEAKGMKVWYAPRNSCVGQDYASSIVDAITRCTHFVVIISKNSMQSRHVLNEIDLAFNELNRNLRFLPLRIDEETLAPAFSYYLSRQHWMDAHIPPIEKRLDEFVEKVFG